MRTKILFALLLSTTINLVAQKQEFIGIGINYETKSRENMRPAIAFSYENQFCKHSGFEIGFNQRRADTYFTIPMSNNLYQTSHIMENYISVPVMYKFYSSFMNVSTGLNLDYFVGWKDVTKFGEIESTGFSVNPKLYMGWVMKIGKTIALSPKYYLEPEIQFNPIFKYGYSYYGAALKLKYKL